MRAIQITKASVPGPFKTKNSMPQGNTVVNQVTLDMCGAQFRSEDLRVARHQVAYLSKDKRSRLSTETVAYRNGGAELAMREIGRAIATCPTGYVGSNVAGMPPLQQRFTRLSARPGWEPGTIAMRVTEHDQAGHSDSGIVIYQRHGNLLNGTYAWGTGPMVEKAADGAADLVAKEMNKAPVGDTTNA